MAIVIRQWLKRISAARAKKNRPMQKPRGLFEQLESRELLSFTHPGGLSTLTDLNRMKTEVAAGAHPWMDDWNLLIVDSHAQLTYSDHSTANMGSSRQNADSDAIAAYLDTIRWYVSGDTRYADKAVTIYNHWSSKVNVVPSGTDIPGLIGIAIADFGMGAEILRIYSGWSTTDFNSFKTMMTTYLYPVCHDFLTNHNGAAIDHYWSNWDACNIGALISMGVLCDNQSIFNEGVNYFESGAGMGSIEHAIPYLYPDGLGQEQESGRDQEHAQLAIGLLSTACQVAWNQGVDLFGYDNNRLLAGAEYVARTNLSEPVPFTTYNNSDNVNQYYVSTSGLGRIDDRPIWELIYNHYAVLEGLSAPNVKAMAALLRPEGGTNGKDHIGYGTLLYTLNAAASPYPPAPIPPAPTNLTATAGVGCVMLKWTSSGDTAQGYKVMRSTTSGGPYTSIYSSTTYTLPQYTDTSVSNGTTYYYVVAANNKAGTSGNSLQVSATPQAAGVLPASWTHQDIGTVQTAGTATYASVAGNTLIVAGSGSDIGGTVDSFQFAYQTITGDCTIVARLDSATLSDSGSDKVGIMIRESTSSNSKTVAITLGESGFRDAVLKIRSSTGGSMSSTSGDDYTYLPAWFMLRRVGSMFYAYQSPDGITWYLIGSTAMLMSSTELVGLVVCSRSTSTPAVLATATFDNVKITNSSAMASSVVGRYIFNNNSKFDTVSNDNAIASDKQALLPGQTATFANYTSYSRGINGIMVDIAGLVNPGALVATDFLFKVGNGGAWTTAPSPIKILPIPGAGAGGACRVYVTWADNAIANEWLQVTVLADTHTGLAAADVFYFGNLVGESGNDATVNVQDEDAALNNGTGFTLASITNNYDYNRDRQVNAADALIARSNAGASLTMITGPAAAGEIEPLAASAIAPVDAAAEAGAVLVAASLALPSAAPAETPPDTAPIAAITVAPVTLTAAKSTVDAGGLAAAPGGMQANYVLTTRKITPLYLPLDLYRVTAPLPATLGGEKSPGDPGLSTAAFSLPSQGEIKRPARQQGDGFAGAAFLYDSVLSQTTKSIYDESKTNLISNNLIDEMTRTIVKDQISKKNGRSVKMTDDILATCQF